MTSQEIEKHNAWPATAHRLGPVSVVATTANEAVRQLCQIATDADTRALHVHLVNAYTLALADGDDAYAKLLSEESINLPDGRPLAIISKLIGHVPPLNQIRGPDLFLSSFDVGRRFGVRHYLLGSSEAVLDELQTRLTTRFPGCEIVGVDSPPYRALTNAELATQDARIRAADPDIVWIGLGTPKQDKEAARLAKSTGLTCVAVGAAFDFAAGSVREAPRWMTRFCLEWLFRLMSEPRRLWRRYVFGNVRFLRIVARSITTRE